MKPDLNIKIGPWTLSQHSDGATIACYNGRYALTIDNRTCNVWSAPLKCKKGIYIQKWMTSRARKYLITLHALVPPKRSAHYAVMDTSHHSKEYKDAMQVLYAAKPVFVDMKDNR